MPANVHYRIFDTKETNMVLTKSANIEQDQRKDRHILNLQATLAETQNENVERQT